jgi:hypothetical protein
VDAANKSNLLHPLKTIKMNSVQNSSFNNKIFTAQFNGDVYCIAAKYYLEKFTGKSVHLQYERVTEELYLRLIEAGICCEKVVYTVDASYFNGTNELKCNELEHHCIKIGRKILDVTASQFNDQSGNKMPLIYYGSLPLIYKS